MKKQTVSINVLDNKKWMRLGLEQPIKSTFSLTELTLARESASLPLPESLTWSLSLPSRPAPLLPPPPLPLEVLTTRPPREEVPNPEPEPLTGAEEAVAAADPPPERFCCCCCDPCCLGLAPSAAAGVRPAEDLDEDDEDDDDADVLLLLLLPPLPVVGLDDAAGDLAGGLAFAVPPEVVVLLDLAGDWAFCDDLEDCLPAGAARFACDNGKGGLGRVMVVVGGEGAVCACDLTFPSITRFVII